LSECIEILTEADIKRIIEIEHFHLRVQNAAELIVKGLRNFRVREPRPHVVICALPDDIVHSCGTVRRNGVPARVRLTDGERKILEYVREHQKTGQTTLVPLDDSTIDMIPETSDLRRIIKAEAMSIGIPTQLAKPATFQTDPGDKSIQDEATRAWNLSVALYYKAEGYPWKLTEMPTGTCYVGISFYRSGPNIGTSMAQVFTHTGEGLVLRGGRAVLDQITKTPHLSEENAFRLVKDALELYENQMRQSPTRLVVHKSSRYWPEELSGFRRASRHISLTDFVTIVDRGVRFMRRRGKYPPVRGTVVEIGEGDYLLFTKGWIPYHGTYPGLRIPAPLEVAEHFGDTPPRAICKEILALTKMNWNSADFCIREPITLAYSREVGRILAYVPEEVIPRPEYRYYM